MVKAMIVSVIQLARALTFLGGAIVGGLMWRGEDRLPGLNCQLWLLVDMWSWTLSCYLMALCLSFLISKMGSIIVPIPLGLLEDKWEIEWKLLDIVSDTQVLPSKGLLAKKPKWTNRKPPFYPLFCLVPLNFFLLPIELPQCFLKSIFNEM